MFLFLNIAIITFQMIMTYMLYDNFMECNKKVLKNVLKIFFILVLLANYLIGGGLIATTVIYIAAALIGTLCYDSDWKSKLFCALGIALISDAMEYIAGALLLILNQIRPIDLIDETTYRIVGMISSKILLFIAIKFICIFWNKKYSHIYRNYWIALMTLPIMNMAIVMSVVYFFKSVSPESEVPMLILMICTMYSSVISFYLFDRLIESFETKLKNALLESHVDEQNEYMRKQTYDNKKMISIKHDFKNHLQILFSLIKDKNINEAEKYILELGVEQLGNDDEVMNTGNLSLDSIINSKISQAHKNNITTELNIKKLPCDLKLTGVECCMLLGNLFDNAIEGCLGLEPEKRKIIFDIFFRQRQLFIGIQNTTDKKVEFANGKPLTDKSDKTNHGIGINNITEVVEKYNGIFRASCHDGFYETNIILFDV